MIHNFCGEITVECDSCGETVIDNDFDDLISSIKSEGWKITRVGVDWMHYCPLCAEKMKPTAASDFAGVGGKP